jgi:hypothetical protein
LAILVPESFPPFTIAAMGWLATLDLEAVHTAFSEAMPEPVIIANRPFWARVLVVFWAIEVAMGLLFARTGFGWLGQSENGMAVLLAVMGLLLSAAGVVMTGLCWRIARLSGPAIEMRADGLRDHRLSPATIPWEAISWQVRFNGHSHSLYFDVAEPGRAMVRPYWPQRALGLFNRLFRYPEFSVITLGTGLGARDIGARMAAFKPAAG